ncbi:MAG TPA: VCBS repeat-containing protein [Streptosporangiaceae bacterium]|nr:VCBS repeat-containing protein [Streptosporangiaceae bacterium]
MRVIPRVRLTVLAAVLAAAAVLAVPAAGRAMPAAAGHAASAVQVAVIPPDPSPTNVSVSIVFAGSSGFLTVASGWKYYWTSTSSGLTVPVTALDSVVLPADVLAAGPDSIALRQAVGPGAVSGEVTELDLATMTWTHYAIPSGYRAGAIYGNQVLASAGNNSGPLAVLTYSSTTSYQQVAVTNMPTQFKGAYYWTGGHADAVIIPSSSGEMLVSLANATASVIPLPPSFTVNTVDLTPSQVGFRGITGKQVLVYSLSGLLDGSQTSYQTVTLPDAVAYTVALVNGAVLVGGPDQTSPVQAYPDGGGAPTTVLGSAEPLDMAGTPDGSVVAVGSSGPGDWGVQRMTGDGSGGTTASELLALNQPQSDGGLTITQGLVRHVEYFGTSQWGQGIGLEIFNHLLVPDTSIYDAGSQSAAIPAQPLPCAANVGCVRVGDGNTYGVSVLSKPGTSIELNVSGVQPVALPSAGGSIVDTSMQYEIVDGTDPARQYVVEPGSLKPLLSTGPVTGAGLFFFTLWRASGPGSLVAKNLLTGVVTGTLSTGSSCTASEVQAAARWVYWSCGASGPAGVIDLRTGARLAVPAGLSLLGDGYLVQATPAAASTLNLTLYDFHADSLAAPVRFATIPAGPAADSRDITWAVDKYSGDIAYVDAGNAVHVIDPGVPRTPAASQYPQSWDNGAVYYSPNGGFLGWLAPGRPITSWTVRIRRYANGPVIYQTSGGSARMVTAFSWNGLLPHGLRPYSGWYTWTARATADGSASSAPLAHGTVLVYCGRIPFRSEDCDGAPGLLAVDGPSQHYATWSGYWYEGGQNGKLATGGPTDYWPLCSAGAAGPSCVTDIVPFGDFTGDGFADLLVKYRNGVLRAFRGIGQAWFGEGTKSFVIGRNWNQYNLLAAPGDVTGDGRPDLVARDTRGRLWLYAAAGHGKFAARRFIGRGWSKYVRVIGAGSLAGAGAGDLLALDRRGAMWLYAGNGHGGFRAPVWVSRGWAGYNAIIGIGDLNNDGFNDLVARDPQGRLWFFAGNGKGGFAGRRLIARYWKHYVGLF